MAAVQSTQQKWIHSRKIGTKHRLVLPVVAHIFTLSLGFCENLVASDCVLGQLRESRVPQEAGESDRWTSVAKMTNEPEAWACGRNLDSQRWWNCCPNQLRAAKAQAWNPYSLPRGACKGKLTSVGIFGVHLAVLQMLALLRVSSGFGCWGLERAQLGTLKKTQRGPPLPQGAASELQLTLCVFPDPRCHIPLLCRQPACPAACQPGWTAHLHTVLLLDLTQLSQSSSGNSGLHCAF